MDRIERLRIRALESVYCSDEFMYGFHKYYGKSDSSDKTPEERYGDAFCYAFSQMTPSVDNDELIVGKRANCLSPDKKYEWENSIRDIFAANVARAGGGQDSHMAIDYELILHSGLRGIIEKINELSARCVDDGKKSFYTVCRRCLEAVIEHSKAYSEKAKELAAQEGEPKRRSELENIARICAKVPEYPAESFYEAVQSVHFVTHCVSLNPFRPGCQQFQLAHPDRYLLPYYEKDIAAGNITKEYAQLLLDCLGIQINHRVHSGLSSGYMVGGRDKNGVPVANDLTEMCMQVIDDIRLVYPAVGFCCTVDTDDKYLEKACEILSHGRSHPAIFNDDVIRRGLKNYGLSDEETYDYIHSTCVEITPTAASNAWVASPYTNMAAILLGIMDREYESFESLLATYFGELDDIIKRNFEEQNAWRSVRNENSMNPLLSCFVNDCLERGCDIEKGGARYNWIMPSFVGMANLVDSLYAVKYIVFDKKEKTMAQLKEIVDNDFAGNEAFRLRVLNTIPKYGNDNDDVDGYFGIMTEHIISECKKYIGMHSNGNVVPSVFCWIMHECFGRETGATPDGRRAGFPLGDGSGPCQGREMNGPTASVLSSTKWDHHKFIGGVAVNMKFSKKALGAHSIGIMRDLVKTYLKRGGFEMQINVIDRETLEKAVKSPEEYGDLVVRIGGYSDYFVRLTPEMQKEVILRTEHEI